MADAEVVGGCSWDEQGVWLTIQFKGLADGTERILDGASANGVASAIFTVPDPFNEHLNQSGVFFLVESL